MVEHQLGWLSRPIATQNMSPTCRIRRSVQVSSIAPAAHGHNYSKRRCITCLPSRESPSPVSPYCWYHCILGLRLQNAVCAAFKASSGQQIVVSRHELLEQTGAASKASSLNPFLWLGPSTGQPFSTLAAAKSALQSELLATSVWKSFLGDCRQLLPTRTG